MKTFLRLLTFTKPYWYKVVIAFIASILFAIFNAASLWIVSSLIDTIISSEPKQLSDYNTLSSIYKKIEFYFNQYVLGLNKIDQLKFVCYSLFATFIIKNIFYYINWVYLAFVELKSINDIRNELFSKIQKYQISFFDKNKSGEVVSIMLNDVNMIAASFQKTFQIFFHETISMLIMLVLLFSISYELTLLVIITMPVAAFIINKVSQSIKRRALRVSYKGADITNIVIEKISAVKIVKAFNMTQNEIKKFIKSNFKFFQLHLRQRSLLGVITPINDIIGVSLACLLLWYGGRQVLLFNQMSSDDFLRFIIFLFALLQPARKLSGGIAFVQQGIAGATRVFSLLDLDLEKKDNLILNKKNSFDKVIQFKNVNFKYDKDGSYILKNINAKILKGEKIALVGPSGSGKTTFANLLLDYYEPFSGTIDIDGIDYKKIKTSSIRNMIGLVTQEPILFNDTIKNNIMYGSNHINEEQIYNATKIANIYDYINSIKDKLDTNIGEKGTKLSGGQKQRISIARAILKNPPILVLDEATSSLDSESELKVQNAINNLVKDRTVIIIAHRLSTIKDADKIFVFNNGSIEEVGSHDDLLDKKGIYSRLCSIQFGLNKDE